MSYIGDGSLKGVKKFNKLTDTPTEADLLAAPKQMFYIDDDGTIKIIDDLVINDIGGIRIQKGAAPYESSMYDGTIFGNGNFFSFRGQYGGLISGNDSSGIKLFTAGDVALSIGINYLAKKIKIEKTTGNVICDGSIQTAGYKSSDGSAGWTGTFTNGDGNTVTVKNGLITDVS